MWWEIGSLTLLSLKELHLAIAVKSMSPNILYPTQSTDQQSWWGFQQCWKFQSMSNHEPCWPQTTGILEAFWPETISKRRYTTNFDTISSSRHLGTAETTIYGQKVDGIDWTHPFWARPASHRSFLEQTDVDIDNVRHAQLAEHSKHTNSRGMLTANQTRCPWVVSEGFNILTCDTTSNLYYVRPPAEPSYPKTSICLRANRKPKNRFLTDKMRRLSDPPSAPGPALRPVIKNIYWKFINMFNNNEQTWTNNKCFISLHLLLSPVLLLHRGCFLRPLALDQLSFMLSHAGITPASFLYVFFATGTL